METGTEILYAHSISIGYRSKQQQAVAGDLTVSLKAGSLISLIGANGIGKSTLLRTLSGLQKPLSGHVLLNRKDLYSYSAPQLAQQLSLVLTEPLPSSNLSVFELVALGRQPFTNWLGALSGQDIKKVREALTLTQTLHLAHKKHFEISDGQLQNVLIARALAQDTPLIILDEPTTHLDLPHKVNLLRLLKKLTVEKGKCILFSTHDLDLALQMADELLIMKKGNLVQCLPQEAVENAILDDLFNSPNIIFDKNKGSFIVRPF